MLAFEQFRNAAGVIDDLEAAAELAHGIVDDLAMFSRNQSDDFLGVFLEQLSETEHDFDPLRRRRVAPLCKRRFSCPNSRLDRLPGGHRDVFADHARGRVRYRQGAIRVGDIFTGNEMANGIGRINFCCWRCVHDFSGVARITRWHR